MAASKYNTEMNYYQQFKASTTGIDPLYLQFSFQQIDESDVNSLYLGNFTMSSEKNTTETNEYFVAGAIDIDSFLEDNQLDDLTSYAGTDQFVNPFVEFKLMNLNISNQRI